MAERGDGGGGADEGTEATVLKEVSVVAVVGTLWPLQMLLSVSVAVEGRR